MNMSPKPPATQRRQSCAILYILLVTLCGTPSHALFTRLQGLRGKLPGLVSTLDAAVALVNATDKAVIQNILSGDVVTLGSDVVEGDLSLDVQVKEENYFSPIIRWQYSFRNGNVTADPISETSASASLKPSSLALVGQHQLIIKAIYLLGLRSEELTIRWWVVHGNATSISATPPRPSAGALDAVPAPLPKYTQTLPGSLGPQAVTVMGELRQWHKITLAFTGRATKETATPNPFTDYRLDVVFTRSDSFSNSNNTTQLVVPGYFAADGNAANTHATSGDQWHCHFAPPAEGKWTWRATFVKGPLVALEPYNVIAAAMCNSTNTQAGSIVVTAFHGVAGTLEIEPTDKVSPDLRAKGLLRSIPDKHHYQFAGTGEWFLKTGSDSPENFLAYDDFDNTPNNGGYRKSWGRHIRDYDPGDPTWDGGKGKGMIGALNYLSTQGMRAFSFLTMNINGDDNNVFPYISPSSQLRIDVSKTAQWEIVFEHANAKGLFLHFKTQENESDQVLDNGDLGKERRLYYRELVARFSHHLALNWNLGEENTNTDQQRKEYADWIRALDPYQHPIVVHTFIEDQDVVYQALYGYPSVNGASIQTLAEDVFTDTLTRVRESTSSGRSWVVTNDEQGGARTGVKPDRVDSNHFDIRHEVLWGNIMVRGSGRFMKDTTGQTYSSCLNTQQAGGAGVEFYFGYGYSNSDLTCENFRSRAHMWDQARYAVNFFVTNAIPFQDMVNENTRIIPNDVNGGDDSADDDYVNVNDINWCLVGSKDIVVYLPYGGTADIDLRGWTGLSTGASNAASTPIVSIRWYNPREGGPLLVGTIASVSVPFGLSSISLGQAPNTVDKDWVVLLRREA
jgi:hypothetical protein